MNIKKKTFLLLQGVQKSSGANSGFYSMATSGAFPRIRRNSPKFLHGVHNHNFFNIIIIFTLSNAPLLLVEMPKFRRNMKNSVFINAESRLVVLDSFNIQTNFSTARNLIFSQW